MAKKTEAYRAAQARYDKKQTVQIGMKLNKITDADILEVLEKQKNKQGYIKSASENACSKEPMGSVKNGFLFLRIFRQSHKIISPGSRTSPHFGQ